MTECPPKSLLETARELYAQHLTSVTPLSNAEIAKRMGISREWVRRFLNGEIPNPGVVTLEAFIKVIKDANV